MKILINSDITSEQQQQIEAVSDAIQIVKPQSSAETTREIVDTDIVFGGFNRSLFENAEQLKWVQVWAAGVDGILFSEFVDSDVILTSAKGFVGTHLADQAWALILGLLRGVGRSVRERTWDNKMSIRLATWELGERTLGIVGLGGTGIEVARRAQGFEMHVIAVDPEAVEAPTFVHEIWKMDRFDDLLAESDIVCICAPLTPETECMFNDAVFQKMQSHALLINVTRGKIVDGEALIRALNDERIGGAGLDVTPVEPLPADSPLWDMPNVIITPHVAGGSPIRMDRTVALFCDNLERFLVGKPLLSVIDKRKGY
ncbi:MAG: D-2-hydroxyacid dehydrogenase [Candidatus Poribacteria bacterium]|nr:D-2-hydroxyacid dehydrogenase [Candidatus Poribacteria bacterium]